VGIRAKPADKLLRRAASQAHDVGLLVVLVVRDVQVYTITVVV